MTTHHPMDPIFDEIRAAMDSGLYYLAIAVALSVPDVCASLELDPDPALIKKNRQFSGNRYAAWFSKYMQRHYSNLTGEDCYRLRCGVLHAGKMGRPDDQYDRVMFEVPSEHSNNNHETLMEGNVLDGTPQPHQRVLILLAVDFCEEVIDAAHAWYRDRSEDAFVQANMHSLVKMHPRGIEPYSVFIGPTPVIG